jgi:hypothetical protein
VAMMTRVPKCRCCRTIERRVSVNSIASDDVAVKN